ncbi:hypothetical protein N0V83_005216 [Neocucurbitaria cava]|uniref:Nitronate monooxygenase domain-containing protein n=1 Tax=Neocucurbitaria cava TaxID=798079 RepID=A0A9W9CMY8_9PLEO|nr:hypothetical protein N0V83_005216 [Neocucurbitaria cava]
MGPVQRLKKDYPWIKTPLVVGAPMRLIALADMAVEISRAGIGFINWGASLTASIPLIAAYRPAAVWFFAPSSLASLAEWATQTRAASPETKIWVQVGSVAEALDAVRNVKPDVLVVQGTDAGGHGLVRGASLIPLLPEISDALRHPGGGGDGGEGEEGEALKQDDTPVLLAAGGISDARGACAALTLGASGIVLGTRLLAATEANISRGYQAEILRAQDGGQTTVRTKVYDQLRGTNWAETHNARGVVNRSYVDAVGGMDEEENRRLYEEEMGKGMRGGG